MPEPLQRFAFTAELWIYPGKAAWYFLTLPQEAAARIKFFTGKRRGWGSVRVTAAIGNTAWQTSVFPDAKSGSYLLPVKAEVRKNESLDAGGTVTVTLDVEA